MPELHAKYDTQNHYDSIQKILEHFTYANLMYVYEKNTPIILYKAWLAVSFLLAFALSSLWTAEMYQEAYKCKVENLNKKIKNKTKLIEKKPTSIIETVKDLIIRIGLIIIYNIL